MAITVDWDQVPDSSLLNPGMYELEVTLEKQTSKVKEDGSGGNLMYKGTFRVAEGQYEGLTIFDYFTIGNAEDREGKLQETWNNAPGAKRLKRLFKALMLPLQGDVDALVDKANGQHVIGAVEQKVEGGTGQYANVKRNNITAFHPMGSRALTAPTPVPAKAAGAPTVTCPYCDTAVARADYSKHVKTKHPDEA